MDIPCNFKRVENGWWKCTSCGHVHRRPSSRAPVRLCGKPEILSPTSTLVSQKRRPKPRKKPVEVKPLIRKPLELGDAVHEALSFVGITPERVTKWLGRPCKCPERIENLNQLSRWARRTIEGKTENAKKFLEELIK